MKVDSLLTTTSDNGYYDPGFIQTIYISKSFLLNNMAFNITLDPHSGYKNNGDLFGVLDDLNISKQYHLPILILNGYLSPSDFNYKTNSLIVPNLNAVDTIKRVYSTKN